MTTEVALERALGGAEFLDARVAGWRERIISETLDVGDPGNCVIQQVCGDFQESCARLGLSIADQVRLGFNLYTGDGGYGREDFNLLTSAWRRVCEEKREAVAV